MCRVTLRVGSCAWNEKYPAAPLTRAALAAWEIFQNCQTQWSVGMNGATGMRYEGVEAFARLSGLELVPHVFALFRVLEAKRLGIWSEEREAARKAAEDKKRR